MVTERLAERTPDAHELVELGRRLSALNGSDEVRPRDLERYDCVSTAGPALRVGLVNVIRLVWAESLPYRRSSLIDQHLGYIRHDSHHLHARSPLMTAQPRRHDASGPSRPKPSVVVWRRGTRWMLLCLATTAAGAAAAAGAAGATGAACR
jgi:hypothetical protein